MLEARRRQWSTLPKVWGNNRSCLLILGRKRGLFTCDSLDPSQTSWFIDDKEKNHSFNKHSIAYLVPEKAGLLSLNCINLHINLYILIPSCSHCWSIKMQKSGFYRFCCYKKSVWRYLVPEGWSSKTFYFLANRQGADNCDKTLHSLMPDHRNVTMTKKAAKPQAALRRMENSLCRSQWCQIV